jgi:hypothetical protein
VAGAGLAVLPTLIFHVAGSVIVNRKSTPIMKGFAALGGVLGIFALVV